jgi:AraC-like DNA-binding protein
MALLAEANEWHWKAMWRGSFGLSHERPVSAMHGTHVNPQDSVFDMHYEVEIGIVRSGGMVRHYLDFDSELGPGDVWLCGMWEPHGFHIRECPCEVAVMVASPEYLGSLGPPTVDWLAPFTAEPHSRPTVGEDTRAYILGAGARIRRLEDSAGPSRDAWLQLLFPELLLRITEDWSRPTGLPKSQPHIHSRLRPALQLVFGEQRLVTESEAAGACGMSRNIFCNHFRTFTGISFSRFALRHRLRSAAGLIATSDMPLKAIAADWGFTDVSHLHRVFEKHYGCSPAQYRKRAAIGDADTGAELSGTQLY